MVQVNAQMHHFEVAYYNFKRKYTKKFSIWNIWRKFKFSNLSFNALTIIVFLILKLFFAIMKIVFPEEAEDDFILENQNKETSDVGTDEHNIIHPFKINVPESVLKELKIRLEGTRYDEQHENSCFKYGFNSIYLQKIMEYWKTQYDWRKHEKELNKYPQFTTRIDDLDVHFIHVKPNLTETKKLKVIPLLLIHGWPGSCANFIKLIPQLTQVQKGQDFVFEIVCPSIPGFGFSEASRQTGLNGKDAARIFMILMERLGFSQFYVQGCDWGSVVASLMARFCPTRVQGMHVNMCFSLPNSFDSFLKFIFLSIFPFLMNSAERRTIYPLRKKIKTLWNETGYSHLLSSKPDTIGCFMADSPAGMAAYFLEKVLTEKPEISLQNDELLDESKLDEVLTMATICWASNNFTSGARFYKNIITDMIHSSHERLPIFVPVGIAVFPDEVLMLPKLIMEQQMENLVSYTLMPTDGHCVTMEVPDLLAKDVRQFVTLVENR